MLKFILSMMMIFISFIMFFLTHPLSLGLMIFFQTFFTCLFMGLIYETYWFSYILFLVFLGGLLVLFMYISSIASNEIFNMNNFIFMNTLFIFFIFIMIIFFFKNLFWMNFSINYEISHYFNLFIFSNNESMMINLNKLYNNQTFFMMLMMMIYLFITLVAVVKITNIFLGPLRSNF